MSAFWDSSAIVPLCCAQAATIEARRLLKQLDRTVAWWGTPVEVRSAFARLLRQGELDQVQLTAAINSLDKLQRGCGEVLATEAVRALALTLPDDYALRAGDAWQLAAALVWCRERLRWRSFVCWDSRLAKAAAKAGFTVHPE